MASSTYALLNLADETVTYTLVSQTENGAQFRDATRALALPRSLNFQYKIGNPGAKGNDKLIVTLKDTVQNATTGLVSTGSAKLEVSVPRDSAWTTTFSEDLMAQMANLLSDTAIGKIADAIVV
jgi:hypothetical protein